MGECRLTLAAAAARRELADLREKAHLLPFAHVYENIDARLFVAKNPPPGAVSLAWCE